MPDDLEEIVTQALTDQGGPPEIAAQVVAIAREYSAKFLIQCESLIVYWIRFHIGPEWSAIQFRTWLDKYEETERATRRTPDA